jgi:hypothetical protein
LVYFMQVGSPASCLVKIGFAEDVPARAATIRSTLHEPVAILGVMPGARPEEAELHRLFAHIRRKGEYFFPEPDLLDYIRHNAIPLDSLTPDLDPVKVQIDRALIGMAKMIATHRGISLAELLSETLRTPIEKAYAQMLRDLEGKR